MSASKRVGALKPVDGNIGCPRKSTAMTPSRRHYLAACSSFATTILNPFGYRPLRRAGEPQCLPGNRLALVVEVEVVPAVALLQHIRQAARAVLDAQWRFGPTHVGSHPAWMQAQDGDAAALGMSDRESPHKRVQRRLAHAVELVPTRSIRRDRAQMGRHECHGAALNHLRQQPLGNADGRYRIGPHDLRNVFARGLQRRLLLRTHDAGIQEQQMQPPTAQALRQRIQISGTVHIDGLELHLFTVCSKKRLQTLRLPGLSRRGNHVPAAADKLRGESQTEAARGADDQCRPGVGVHDSCPPWRMMAFNPVYVASPSRPPSRPTPDCSKRKAFWLMVPVRTPRVTRYAAALCGDTVVRPPCPATDRPPMYRRSGCERWNAGRV